MTKVLTAGLLGLGSCLVLACGDPIGEVETSIGSSSTGETRGSTDTGPGLTEGTATVGMTGDASTLDGATVADTTAGTTDATTSGTSTTDAGTTDASTSSGGSTTDATTTDTSTTDASTTDASTTDPTTTDATTTDATTTDASTTDPTTTGGSTDTGITECPPILVELLYDVAGSDGGFEWIKLYNPCEADIDLTGYALGWGPSDYTAGVADLQGVLPGGGCYVVGGPESVMANANPVFDLVLDFEPNLPNGGADAAGFGLFVGPAAGITALSIPIDAVIYGDANTNGILGPDGIAIPPHVTDAGDGESNRRTALDPLWIVEPLPMPNVCPPF